MYESENNTNKYDILSKVNNGFALKPVSKKIGL